jgi:hypothetical protein
LKAIARLTKMTAVAGIPSKPEGGAKSDTSSRESVFSIQDGKKGDPEKQNNFVGKSIFVSICHL